MLGRLFLLACAAWAVAGSGESFIVSAGYEGRILKLGLDGTVQLDETDPTYSHWCGAAAVGSTIVVVGFRPHVIRVLSPHTGNFTTPNRPFAVAMAPTGTAFVVALDKGLID